MVGVDYLPLMRLQTYLGALVLAALVPLLVFAAIIVRQDVLERQEILERGMQDTAHALSLAIDGEVRSSLAVLETLAGSSFLDHGDLKSFHEVGTRAVSGRKGSYLVLFDESGQALVNSSRPFGSTLPNPLAGTQPAGSEPRYPDAPLGGADPLLKVLQSGRPVVSDLFVSLATREPRIGVDVPVMREGRLKYVLEMSIDAATFTNLLAGKGMASDSLVAILDRRGVAIVSSDDSAARVGHRLAGEPARQIAASDSGSGRVQPRGVPVHHVFTRSPLTGWTTSLRVTQASMLASQSEALTVLGGGALLALLVGLGAALLIGRRIARPISNLAASASSIAQGEKVEPGPVGVREIEDLRHALAAAGAAGREVTAERERRHIAEEGERRFREIADAAPVLIWMSGTDKLCTWFNKSWLDFVGRPMAQELGNGWADNVHPEDFERCLHTYSCAFDERQPFSMEYRLRRHDGEYRWVRDDGIARADARGKFAGYIGGCVDIDDFKRSEATLKQADRHKDEFVAMLGHELRNPLAAIANAAYVLRTADLDTEHAAKARGVIDRQARHMARLIDDLLDISRLSVGKAELSRKTFELGEALTELVAVWRSAGRLGSHRVELNVEQPAWVYADRTRIEQIVSNLLDNSLKFTPHGESVSVEVRAAPGEAVITVTDAGEGIAPQDISRVFQLFAQGTQGIARSRGGMGIGLALVKRIAEMHGGSVTVESEGVGLGTRVTVRFPSVAKPAQEPAVAALRPESPPRRVLIIEDNDDTRQMLRTALAMNGHEVDEAADGASGLAAAASLRPDVALVDIGLPDIDGYEVARRLRQVAPDGKLVLVAITGYGQPADRDRSRQAGFDAHLTKPIGPEHLREAISLLRAAS